MRRLLVAAVVSAALALLVAGAMPVDPEPPSEALQPGGRMLWQLGEDGGLKLAGASPPAAPQPRVWTFTANCRPGVCSGLCWSRTGHYNGGRCVDSSSGRRYCKCFVHGDGAPPVAAGAAASTAAAAAATAAPPAPPS